MSAPVADPGHRRQGYDQLPALTKVAYETDLVLLGLAALVIAVALALQVTPAADGVTLFGWPLPESCGAKKAGGSCPGCGLTRSFVLGVRFDPTAFRLHPIGPLLLALVAAQIPYRSWRLWVVRRGLRRLPPGRVEAPRGLSNTWALWIGGVLTIGMVAVWALGWTELA